MSDVDDERLGALFRAAASDSAAPAPGFDHEAVVRASRRITVRRRAAVTVGGLALFALVGIGGTVALPGPSSGGDATVAAPMIAPARPPAESRTERQAQPPAAAESAPGAAGGGPSPLGPGTTECADRQDPAVRAIVEEYLPEVIGAPEAAITMECRPAGERGVNIEVRDGAATGLLTVQYLPPGAQPEPVEGAVVAPTASGGTVVVSSRGERAGAPAPFADRLSALATHLSPRL
jgi:hypothetical protein